MGWGWSSEIGSVVDHRRRDGGNGLRRRWEKMGDGPARLEKGVGWLITEEVNLIEGEEMWDGPAR